MNAGTLFPLQQALRDFNAIKQGTTIKVKIEVRVCGSCKGLGVELGVSTYSFAGIWSRAGTRPGRQGLVCVLNTVCSLWPTATGGGGGRMLQKDICISFVHIHLRKCTCARARTHRHI